MRAMIMNGKGKNKGERQQKRVSVLPVTILMP